MMNSNNKKRETYSISEKSDILKTVDAISLETENDFDIVLKGNDLKWLVNSFISIKSKSEKIRIFCFLEDEREYNLAQKILKIGIDGIIFGDKINAEKIKQIEQKLNKNPAKEISKEDAKSLEELRQQIDVFDNIIMDFIDYRYNVVKEIQKIKSKNNLPIFDSKRFNNFSKKLFEPQSEYKKIVLDALHFGAVLEQAKSKE